MTEGGMRSMVRSYRTRLAGYPSCARMADWQSAAG
jgi:hypothetical protein